MPVSFMNRAILTVAAACLAAGLGVLAVAGDKSLGPGQPGQEVTAPPGVAEARLRSRLLHETIHGALQVMHRDFFRQGQRLSVPSKSLKDVFAELERTWRVKVRWLAVDAEAMNVEHRPARAFEERAVKAIAGGGEMFEAADGGVYRYAGRINLGNQYLKCHVPGRTSLEDRKAAVVIAMPLDLRDLTAK
jgi:hypothetical protein